MSILLPHGGNCSGETRNRMLDPQSGWQQSGFKCRFRSFNSVQSFGSRTDNHIRVRLCAPTTVQTGPRKMRSEAGRNEIMPHNEKNRCVVIGCGGHGRVVLDVLMNAGELDVIGFLDSDTTVHGRRVDGVPVMGHPDDLEAIRDREGIECGIVAIGDNGVRRAFGHRLELAGIEVINAVHPSANVARNVSLGKNIVIAAGALVSAHCQIGDSVILNTGCIVDHESLIGTATHICPGARLAGRVTVESGAFVGIGATIIQNTRVGYEAIVGAGAVVISDVAPMTTVVGVPAQEVKQAESATSDVTWLLPELRRADQIAHPVAPVHADLTTR